MTRNESTIFLEAQKCLTSANHPAQQWIQYISRKPLILTADWLWASPFAASEVIKKHAHPDFETTKYCVRGQRLCDGQHPTAEREPEAAPLFHGATAALCLWDNTVLLLALQSKHTPPSHPWPQRRRENNGQCVGICPSMVAIDLIRKETWAKPSLNQNLTRAKPCLHQDLTRTKLTQD